MAFTRTGTVSHDSLADVSAADHHAAVVAGDLNFAALADVLVAGDATAAELETLTAGGTTALHKHQKEFTVPVVAEISAFAYTVQKNDFPLSGIGAGVTDRFVFTVPSDFGTLVSAVVVVIPDASETIQWDVNTDFGAGGEAHNLNSDSITDDTQLVTLDELEELDVSAALTDIAANDHVGLEFVSNTATIRVALLRIVYT